MYTFICILQRCVDKLFSLFKKKSKDIVKDYHLHQNQRLFIMQMNWINQFYIKIFVHINFNQKLRCGWTHLSAPKPYRKVVDM